MGIIITVSNADYSANAVTIPLPSIDFDILSLGATNVSHNQTTNALSFDTVANVGYFEFAQTSDVVSAKVIVPPANSVPLHALCVGTDASGNAIVVYLNGSGNVYKFDKSGMTGDIVSLYTIPSTPPNTAKGNEVTITHGVTYVTIAYSGYTYNLLYSNVPTLVTKSIGVLATGLGTSTYTFEKLL